MTARETSAANAKAVYHSGCAYMAMTESVCNKCGQFVVADHAKAEKMAAEYAYSAERKLKEGDINCFIRMELKKAVVFGFRAAEAGARELALLTDKVWQGNLDAALEENAKLKAQIEAHASEPRPVLNLLSDMQNRVAELEGILERAGKHHQGAHSEIGKLIREALKGKS